MTKGVIRIDTRDLAPERQFEAYRKVRLAAEPGARSLNQVTARHGHLAVGTTWTGHRSVVHFAESDDPHVLSLEVGQQDGSVLSAIVSSGPMQTVTDGVRCHHPPRSLILTHARQQVEFALLGRGSLACIRVDRNCLHVSDRLVAAAIAGSECPMPWWRQLVLGAAQVLPMLGVDPDLPPDPIGIDRYAAGVLELAIRTAAGTALDQAPVSGRPRRRHAESYIEQHLLDPALRGEAVASYLGISTRQLARDLAGGPSVSAMINDARLSYADRLLRDPTRSGLSIAAISQMCRFSSQQLFSRSYKARYGISPRRARMVGTQGHDDPGPATDPDWGRGASAVPPDLPTGSRSTTVTTFSAPVVSVADGS